MAKRGRGKWLGRILIVLFLIATTSGFWIPVGINIFFTKNYHFTDVTIDGTVDAHGDLQLVEKRTFKFKNGPFTYAYYDVEDPLDHIRDFSVSEVQPDGSETPLTWTGGHSIVSNGFEARWDYPPTSGGERTFVFRYTDVCAVDRYEDAAHLYWQFIGTGWEKKTDHALITLHLPPISAAGSEPTRVRSFDCSSNGVAANVEPTTPLQPGDVRAWAHGPLNGSIRMPDPATVVFEASDIPAGNYVEGSVLFPSASVPFAEIKTPSLVPQVVADEQRWAVEANALRAKHRVQMAAFWFLFIAVPLLLGLLSVLSRLRDRVADVPKVLQEPPEDDAVEVAFLWAKVLGRPPANAYRAQLLRLVRTGAVELRAEGTVSDPEDLKLIRKQDPEGMTETDQDFMTLLFGDQSDGDTLEEVSASHPRARSTKNPIRYDRWLAAAKHDVTKTMVNIEKSDARFESIAATVIAVGAAGFGVWGAIWGQLGTVGWWLLPWSIVCLIFALRQIRGRLDPELRERVAELDAFRRYLTDFSSLPDAPAMAVVIWEQYMEWAVALDVADRVEKQIKALVPVEQLRAPWPNASVSGLQAVTMFHDLGSVSNSIVNQSSASVVSSSSGGFGSSSSFSGGGGGFSGGGGGGGGGTGGGAG